LARAPLFSKIGRLAELAFFPSFCKICGRLLEKPGERILCRDCLERIELSRSPKCPFCGKLYEGAGESHACGACAASPPSFSRHRSAGRYRGVLKDVLLLLKYGKCRPLAPILGKAIHESLRRDGELWRDVDLIVPVPLYKKRRRERGFNQSADIARDIGRRTGIPVAHKVLQKIRSTPPQTSLERRDRIENVRGAYAVGRKRAVEGRIVLLVDDVYTTGSTLGECTRVLRGAGAAEVRAVTVAQA
jgi:ComF family protein